MPDYIYKGKRYSDKQMETFAKDNGLSLNDYASQVGATYVAPGEQTFQYKDKEYSKTQIETFAKDNSLSFDDYLKETGTVKKKGGLASMLTGAASSVGGMVGSGAGRSEEKKDSRLDHLGMETRPQNKIVAHGVKPIQREEDKKLSDEEITNEALRRFNSPLTLYQKSKQEGIQNVPIGEDDPIGNAVNNIQNEAKLAYGELPEKFNVSDIRYATKSLNELAVKDRQIKLLKEYSIENNGIATSLTKQFVDKSAGADVGNINNIPLEEIQKTIPQNNLTAQIAFNRYAKDRTLSEISDKFATFDEMVAHVQGVKLGDLSEAKAGTLIDEMLSDPSVIEKTKESADFANKYRQAQFDLYNKYPSYGMKKMGQMIGQKLADKDMTGWLYSNPSVEKIQKAIDYLKQDGVWGEREDQFYKYNIFPKLLLPGDKGDIIPLTDLGHQTGYAVYHGFDNVSKSLRDIVGKAGGSFLDPSGNSLFQNLGLMKSEEELSKEREQIQYSAPQAEAKNWFTKYIGGAGAFAGTFTPVILGNMAGVPNAANLLLLFEGQNAEKAKDLFKGDVGKQAVYTTLSTLLDVSLMDIVPSVKAAAGIKKMVSSDVLKWTNDLASKKITEDALRRRVIESIPTYLGKIGVHNTKTATILSVYDLAHKGLDAISGKYDFKLANELEEVVNNAKSNWFAGTFMSGMAASGEMKKYSAAIGKVYKEVSEDPIPYIELIRRDKKLSDAEKEDRIKNIEHLAGINYEIGKRGIKGKKAEDFLRLELQKRVADDAVKESKSALLSQEDKKKSAIYEIEQERILNPGISNTEHLDKLFEYLPDGIKKDLSTDGKFDEQKVEGFLKYIAQQSNGLDADWKPHKDGKIPSMSDVPESIIRIANERWAKEIESSKEPIKEEAPSTVLSRGDVEAKKADIEKRRQRDLETITFDKKNNVFRFKLGDDTVGVIGKGYAEKHINEKYDAELAALEKETPSGLSRGDEIEQTYNERKKALDEELNQQLEDNKDILDDIADKGGTQTVRQKIYKEHTNKMVELERWKMGEDLKNKNEKKDNDLVNDKKKVSNDNLLTDDELFDKLDFGDDKVFVDKLLARGSSKAEILKTSFGKDALDKEPSLRMNAERNRIADKIDAETDPLKKLAMLINPEAWEQTHSGLLGGEFGTHRHHATNEAKVPLQIVKGEKPQKRFYDNYINALRKQGNNDAADFLESLYNKQEADGWSKSLSSNTPSKEQATASKVAEQGGLAGSGKVVTSGQTSKDANDILTGKKVFERFSQDEQHGLTEGGKNHVEASLLLAASEGTGGKNNATPEAQENRIEAHAKENGIWTDNTTEHFTEKFGEPIGAGEEAIVWYDKNNGKVVKTQDTFQYENLQQKLDGITLHNAYFPEAPIKVLGFGRNGKGEFQVIVEQPFIQGEKLTPAEIKTHLEKVGFKEDENGHFSNGETIIEDVHTGNAIKTPEGNIIVIDPIMRLNTPEQGYGGARELKNTTQGIENQPPEPPKPPQDADAGKDGEGGGITHAANEVRRKDRLLPEYQKEPQSFEEWNNEAEKAIKEGYDVEKLMDEIEKGKDPNPVENAIRKIYVATLDAEIAKNPTDELLAKQKRFIEIGDLANSRAGRNLVSLKGEGSPLETISDFYVAKMEAAGVDKLTETQKKETKEAFDKVQKADENAVAAMEAYREEIAKLKAENELLRQKKSSTKKGDWQQQRKDAIAGARKALKKIRTGESGVTVRLPILNELIAIAPHVKKYVGALLGEGAYNLKEVVTKAYEEFKGLIDGLTEKDIHDIIAGEYNEPKPTRNELAAKMRDLRDEAYYINKLEKILNGEEPKNEKAKVARNRTITELREKIKDIQSFEGDVAAQQKTLIDTKAAEAKDVAKELTKAEKEAAKKESDELKKKIKDEKDEQKKADLEAKLIEKELKYRSKEEIALERIKTRNENETIKIKERIAKGDFETKKRVSILEDKELQKKFPKEYKAAVDALVKKDEARHEFDIALFKDQMARRTKGQIASDLLGKTAGTVKAITTGIDDSAVAIQTYMSMLVRPRTGARAFAEHILQGASQKRFDRWLAILHNSPDFKEMMDMGLDVTEPRSLIAKKKEEIFDKRFHGTVKINGKEYRVIDAPLKPFERAFTTLGNVTRVVGYRTISAKYKREGYSVESHPELFKSLANRLNTETGRGKQNEYIEQASKVVTLGIWSPRLMAMKFNILGVSDAASLFVPGTKGYYRQLHPKERLAAIKDLAQFAVTVMAVSYLIALANGGEIDDDPLSSTFMDVKLPNGKSYNFTGGFSGYIRALAQFFTGKKHKDGETIKVNPLSTAGRFFRGKVPPLTGAVLNLSSGKDFMGQPATVKSQAISLLPISMRGISQQIERDGAKSFFTQGIPTFFGLNVKDERDYKQSQGNTFTPEDQKDPTIKYFLDKGVELPGVNMSREVHDSETNSKIKLNEAPKEKQEKYIKEWKDGFIAKSKIAKQLLYFIDKYGDVSKEATAGSQAKKFSELTPEQMKKVLSEVGSEASEGANKKVFPK